MSRDVSALFYSVYEIIKRLLAYFITWNKFTAAVITLIFRKGLNEFLR
jgi:hypothetical protein